MPPLGVSPHLVHGCAAMHRRSVVGVHTVVYKKFGVGQGKFGVGQSCVQTSTNLYFGESTLIDQLCVSMSIRTWHHTCHCCIIIYLYIFIILFTFFDPWTSAPPHGGAAPRLTASASLSPLVCGGR